MADISIRAVLQVDSEAPITQARTGPQAPHPQRTQPSFYRRLSAHRPSSFRVSASSQTQASTPTHLTNYRCQQNFIAMHPPTLLLLFLSLQVTYGFSASIVTSRLSNSISLEACRSACQCSGSTLLCYDVEAKIAMADPEIYQRKEDSAVEKQFECYFYGGPGRK